MPRSVLALMVVALAVLAGMTVARFHVWSVVDEAEHYDYVQTVAEDHRLPLITDLRHRSLLNGQDPRALGLPGRSYEAFQPPLYYLLAAPAFDVVSNHRDKIKVVRAFDALLLLVAAGAVWWLAGLVAPGRRELAAAAGGSVLLWPGVVVRSVTISPSVLELLLTTLFLGVLWRIRGGAGRRWMVAAGILAGACLLTKTTLVYLLPLAAFVFLRRRDWRGAALAAGIAAVLVAPWLAFNHSHYGTWTADHQARVQQRSAVNPTGEHYGASAVVRYTRRLFDNVVPTEWHGQVADVAWVQVAVLLVAALLFGGWLAVARRGPPAWFFGAPVITGYLVMVAILLGQQWPSFNLRYLYAALPALAIGIAAVAPVRWARWGIVVSLALIAALWVDGAGAFYFTDVGRALGI